MITKEEYIKYADSAYSIIPLTREIDNAGDTPISLYSKISDQQNTFYSNLLRVAIDGLSFLLLDSTAKIT